MNVRNVIYMVATVSMFCSNVWAMEDVQLSGMREAPSPGGIRSVEPPPMRNVELPPMRSVELPPMRVVPDPPPMRVVPPPPPMARVKPQTGRSSPNAEAKRRGKVIDPHGRGLNQAQIDAMEAQRRAMWNATGGGMVYR